MPAKASVEERWKRVDRAFYRGEELPPVSLYRVGGFYFVLDGHHRVSVAHYYGGEWLVAYVTEFGPPGCGASEGTKTASSSHPTEENRRCTK